MNALRRLVRGSILSLAVLGTVMFVAGPTTATILVAEHSVVSGGPPPSAYPTSVVDETVTHSEAGNTSEGNVDIREIFLGENLTVATLPSSSPQSETCLPGYVHNWGGDSELGYEIWLGDLFYIDTIPPVFDDLLGCAWEMEVQDAHFIYWELTGDVGTPSICVITASYHCGQNYPIYVDGCDEESTFHVYFYDSGFNLLYDHEIFITYTYSNNPPQCYP